MACSILMNFASLHNPRRGQIRHLVRFAWLLVFFGLAQPSMGQGRNVYNDNSYGQALVTDSPDSVYIELLCGQGLSGLAVDTCTARYRLALDSGASNDHTARWAMLLMQSIAAKGVSDVAILDQPGELDDLLRSAKTVMKEAGESSRSLWIQAKYQWCQWYVLQRTLASYLASPTRTATRDWSLMTIRTTLDELDQLQNRIQAAPGRGATTTNKDSPSPSQWTALINDNLLLQIDLLSVRARFYAMESNERIGVASEMLDRIDRATSLVTNAWAGRPKLVLARANALLLLNRPADALTELQNLKQQLLDRSEIQRTPSEEGRWDKGIGTLAAQANRALGDLASAEHWIEQSGGWDSSPELAIEHFANRLADPANQELTEALRIKDKIGKQFGGYWQQRAEALLVSSSFKPFAAQPANSIKLELLLTEARQFIAGKQWQKAIDKLSQGEQSAAIVGDVNKALDFAMKAAAVLNRIQQVDAAQSEFFRAAIEYHSATEAPNAAMMSVWQMDTPGKQSADVDLESFEQTQSIYRGRLTEIISTWPESSQARVATMKLDEAYLTTDRLASLVSLWSKRLEACSQDLKTFDLTVARYALITLTTQDSWLDRSRYPDEDMRHIRPALIELRSKIDGSSCITPKLSKYIDAIETASSWTLHEADIDWESDTTDPISVLIQKWVRTELSYRRLLYLRLQGVETNKDQQKWTDDFIDLQEHCSPKKILLRQAIGGRQWDQLSETMQLFTLAQKLLQGDETAVSELGELHKQNIQSPWWPYRTARLLQSFPKYRDQAIQLWRSLSTGFVPGSDPWLEMRARTVQTLRLKGEVESASKLAQLVLATYPAMSTEWKNRFSPK
jgi:hypothetical protein